MRMPASATAFCVAAAAIRGGFSLTELWLRHGASAAAPGLSWAKDLHATLEPGVPTVVMACMVIGIAILAYRTIDLHGSLDDRDVQFRALLEETRPLTLLLDGNGRILEANNGAALAGVQLDDGALIGKFVWDAPYRTDGIQEHLRKAVQCAIAGERKLFHQEFKESEERTLTFEIGASPIGASPIGANEVAARFILLTVEDTSERNALIRRLIEANDRAQGLISLSMDAIACVEYQPGIDTTWAAERQIDAMFDGVLVDCNAEYARMLGRDGEQDTLIGKPMRAVLSRTTSAERYLRRFIQSGYALQNWNSQEGFQNNQNVQYSTNTIGVVENGQLRRTWAIYRDVTEQSRQMRASAQAKERHASLLQAQEAYFCYEYDPPIDTSESLDRQVDLLLGGRLVECNQAYCDFTGFARLELMIGRSTSEVAVNSVGQASIDAQLRAFVENRYVARNLRFETSRRPGRSTSLIVSSHGIVRNGKLVRRWGVILDVSDQAEIRRALQASEQRFQRIAETSPALIYRIAIGDPIRFDFINDAILGISGYSREEALSNDSVVHEVFSKRNVAQLLAHVGKRADASEPIVTRHLHRTSGEIFLEHRMNSIFDAFGTIVAIEGVALDVTGRLRTEAELKQALEKISALRDELREENVQLRGTIDSVREFEHIVGSSASLRYSLELASKAGPTDATVLILGETGTGKELLARAIHKLSPRRDKPLVCVNCAALPAQLIESELFGYERGAFTGANSARKGRFEIAAGGTLFLDEIGDMSLDLQSKLLRAVQEGTFERLGGNVTLQADVRLIAATNKDLVRAVEAGEFRADLYYRLNVFPISMPALRDRLDDIPLLAHHFTKKHSQRLGKQIDSIAPGFLRHLIERSWPGNVRELEAFVERALISTTGGVLKTPIGLEPPAAQSASSSRELERVAEIVDHSLREAERQHILHVLREAGWIIDGPAGAASILGVAPSTLRSKMKKLGIKRPTEHPDTTGAQHTGRNVH
jgi:PAS domain S-box-containing protein